MWCEKMASGRDSDQDRSSDRFHWEAGRSKCIPGCSACCYPDDDLALITADVRRLSSSIQWNEIRENLVYDNEARLLLESGGQLPPCMSGRLSGDFIRMDPAKTRQSVIDLDPRMARYFPSGAGKYGCSFLTSEQINGCGIYSNRPHACRGYYCPTSQIYGKLLQRDAINEADLLGLPCVSDRFEYVTQRHAERMRVKSRYEALLKKSWT